MAKDKVENGQGSRIWMNWPLDVVVGMKRREVYGCMLCHFSVTLWTAACQAPLFLQAKILQLVTMPSSWGVFSTQGANLCLLSLPALTGGFFTISATWKPQRSLWWCLDSQFERKKNLEDTFSYRFTCGWKIWGCSFLMTWMFSLKLLGRLCARSKGMRMGQVF